MPRLKVKTLRDRLGAPKITPQAKAATFGYVAPARQQGSSGTEELGRAMMEMGSTAGKLLLTELGRLEKIDYKEGQALAKKHQFEALEDQRFTIQELIKDGKIPHGASPFVKQGYLEMQGFLWATSTKTQALLNQDMDKWTRERLSKSESAAEFNTALNLEMGKRLQKLIEPLPDNFYTIDVGFMNGIQDALDKTTGHWTAFFHQEMTKVHRDAIDNMLVRGFEGKDAFYAELEKKYPATFAHEGPRSHWTLDFLDTLKRYDGQEVEGAPRFSSYKGPKPRDTLPPGANPREPIFNAFYGYIHSSVVADVGSPFYATSLENAIERTKYFRNMAMPSSNAKVDSGSMKTNYNRLQRELEGRLHVARGTQSKAYDEDIASTNQWIESFTAKNATLDWINDSPNIDIGSAAGARGRARYKFPSSRPLDVENPTQWFTYIFQAFKGGHAPMPYLAKEDLITDKEGGEGGTRGVRDDVNGDGIIDNRDHPNYFEAPTRKQMALLEEVDYLDAMMGALPEITRVINNRQANWDVIQKEKQAGWGAQQAKIMQALVNNFKSKGKAVKGWKLGDARDEINDSIAELKKAWDAMKPGDQRYLERPDVNSFIREGHTTLKTQYEDRFLDTPLSDELRQEFDEIGALIVSKFFGDQAQFEDVTAFTAMEMKRAYFIKAGYNPNHPYITTMLRKIEKNELGFWKLRDYNNPSVSGTSAHHVRTLAKSIALDSSNAPLLRAINVAKAALPFGGGPRAFMLEGQATHLEELVLAEIKAVYQREMDPIIVTLGERFNYNTVKINKYMILYV